MEAVFYWIMSACIVVFVPFFFASWLTKGMLLKLMRVFGSRGQSLLVEVLHPIQNYYVVGEIKEGRLVVKDRSSKSNKEAKQKSIDVSTNDVFRSFGVNCLRYDETGNRIVKPDFSVVSGFDAIKQENLLLRALYDPKTGKQEQYQVFILLGVILAILIGAYVAYNQGVLLDQIALISEGMITTIANIPTV